MDMFKVGFFAFYQFGRERISGISSDASRTTRLLYEARRRSGYTARGNKYRYWVVRDYVNCATREE